MKRLVGVVIGISVLAILAVVAFLALFDVDKFRPTIEGQLAKALNRDVKIGKLGLRYFPLAIRINDLSIAEASGFQQGTPFASAQQVYANAHFLPLLSGKAELESLELDQPHIQLVRDATGKWNFATLGKPSSGQPGGGGSSFSLGELTINDGIVSVLDLGQSATPSTYDHIDVKVSNFRTDKQFPASVSAHLPGKGAQAMKLEAKVGPLNSATPALTPIHGQFDIKEVSLSDLQTLSRSSGKSEVNGTVTGHGALKSQNGNFTSDGEVAFNNLSSGGVAVGFPVHVNYKASGDLDKELFQLSPVDLQLNQNHFTITGTVDASHAPTNLNLDVKSPPTSIAELARLAGAFGMSTGVQATGTLALNVNIHGTTSNPNYLGTATLSQSNVKVDALTKPIDIRGATIGFQNDSASIQGLDLTVGSTTVKGNLSAKNFKAPVLNFALNADKINVAELQSLSKTPKASTPSRGKHDGLLDKLTGSGTLDAGTLVTSGLVLTQVHSGVVLDRGIVRLSPLTGNLFGGKGAGTVIADFRPADTAFTVQVNLAGVDANQLLTEMSAAKNTLSGALNAKTDLHFIIPPDGDLMKNLNGTLGFNLVNGHLQNIDLISELGKIAKFTGAPMPLGNTTLIKKLAGDLRFTNGVANTSNLVAELPQGSLSGAGSINLVNQLLDMKVTAVLASGASKSFGGTSIGGFMTTALANKNGELVIPAIVKGTTSKPIVEPDVAALAKMRMNNLLPTSSNPGALTTGLLGALSGGKGGGAAGQVKGVLDAIGGQQQQKGQESTPESKAEGIVGGFLKGLSKKKTDK